MNETRRQAYLHAMGIDSYFPRYPLPGAQPSESPLAEQILIEPEVEIEKEVQEPAGISAVTARITTTDSDKIIEANKPAAESEEEAEEAQSSDLRVSLQFFHINDQLAVINEIPYLDDGASDSSVRSLLLAILKALEVESAQIDAPRLFSWPMTEEEDTSAYSQADALLAFEGFMSRHLESSELSHLLVFAGKFRDILQEEVAVNGAFKDTRAEVVVTHSIHAMLRVPVLKKQVWEQLRDLKGRLPSGG